jgi:hypothetical protein
MIQAVSTFMTSQFGILITAVGVGLAAIPAMLHGHWPRVISALGAGGVIMGSGWAANYFLGGGG